MLLKYFASTIIIWLSFITIAASLKDTIVDPDRQEWSAKCDTEEETIDLRNESTHFSIPPKKKSYILQDCHEKSLTLIALSKCDKWKETEAVLVISNIKNLTIHTGNSYVKNLTIANGARVTISRVEVVNYTSPEDIPADELAGLPVTPIIVDAKITNNTVSLGPMFSDLVDGYTFSKISVEQVEDLTIFVYTMGTPRDKLAEVETKLAISENYAYILVISLAVTGVLLALVVFGLIPGLYVYFKRYLLQDTEIWNRLFRNLNWATFPFKTKRLSHRDNVVS